MLEYILSFLPTKLPIGREDFNVWSASVIRLAGVPDNHTTRFALGVILMHFEVAKYTPTKRFFAKQLRKGAANEVAHAVISEIKEEQKKKETVAATAIPQQGQQALVLQDDHGAKLSGSEAGVVC
jgi:hypothetical protein